MFFIVEYWEATYLNTRIVKLPVIYLVGLLLKPRTLIIMGMDVADNANLKFLI